MSRYCAILFDLDGTCTDSLLGFKKGEKEAFARFGVTVTDEDFRFIYQYGVQLGMKRLYDQVDPSLFDDLTAARNECNHRYLREDTTVYPDAQECLSILRAQNVPYGIATSARLAHIESMNVRSRIMDLIPILTTHEDVGELKKPNPLGLQKACEKLGIEPSTGLYVGDAQFDTEAASRIGMDACFIERPTHLSEEIEDALRFATYHIKSLLEVLSIAGIPYQSLSH